MDAVHLRFHADDFSQFSAPDLPQKLLYIWIVAVHISRMENQMVLPRFVQQHFEGGTLCSARLFHMDMLTVLCRKRRVFAKVQLFCFNRHRLDFRVV